MVSNFFCFRWSKIASCLPGRTDNEIKNVWNTHLKKRLNVKNSESSADESKLGSSITSSSSSSSESFLSNERPNLAKTTPPPPGGELNEQASQVITMTDEIEKGSEKQVSNNELIGMMTEEDPKESTTSLSSVESNILISNQIVAYKPEQQLASPLPYPGPYDVDITLEEVDKPNHLFEIPWESDDDDLWKLLENIGSFQTNEVQLGEFPASQNNNFGEEMVQDAEARKWSHDFENEFGVVGETKESNKDQFLPKNPAAEPETDPTQAFDFIDNNMARPESELDLDFIQLWPSWPHNTSL